MSKTGFFEDRETAMRGERMAKGLSLSQLSRMTWVNSSELSKIERGRMVPYEKQAQRIAAALGWEGDIEALFSSAN